MTVHVKISEVPGFDQWRDAARSHLLRMVHPSQIVWNQGESGQSSLFPDVQTSECLTEQGAAPTLSVSKSFLEMAKAACCYKDPDRFALLYRLLFRLKFENQNLLKIFTDVDVMRVTAMVKAVRRDAYKITAFLRFREVDYQGQEHFIAWYEPEHYTLERVLPFFETRFRNMRWSILTPYRAAHWNGEEMTLQDNPDPGLYPKEDKVEQYWLGYYANIFNPARPKKSAMLNQMPKKYWKNMPETALIPSLLRNADERAREMIVRSGEASPNS